MKHDSTLPQHTSSSPPSTLLSAGRALLAASPAVIPVDTDAFPGGSFSPSATMDAARSLYGLTLSSASSWFGNDGLAAEARPVNQPTKSHAPRYPPGLPTVVALTLKYNRMRKKGAEGDNGFVELARRECEQPEIDELRRQVRQLGLKWVAVAAALNKAGYNLRAASSVETRFKMEITKQGGSSTSVPTTVVGLVDPPRVRKSGDCAEFTATEDALLKKPIRALAGRRWPSSSSRTAAQNVLLQPCAAAGAGSLLAACTARDLPFKLVCWQ